MNIFTNFTYHLLFKDKHLVFLLLMPLRYNFFFATSYLITENEFGYTGIITKTQAFCPGPRTCHPGLAFLLPKTSSAICQFKMAKTGKNSKPIIRLLLAIHFNRGHFVKAHITA